MSRCGSVLLWGLVVLSICCAANSAPPPFAQFCVVGAGPGGVQTAHFMKQFGMDFVLFERGPTVGSFFTQYPRQRKLISINKVHTGRDDPEFNLRHDWNSLLTEPADAPGATTKEPLLFKKYSNAYFPHADRLVEYLQDFVEYHGFRSNTFVSHNIERITRSGRFKLHWATTRDGAEVKGVTECSVVVMSSGKDVPVIPRSEGVELTRGCYEIPTDPTHYTNQDLLIIGAGNSALEFIQSVEDYTASVHLASRYPMKLSFQSHYVGHARALNLGILDKYQLKSLDVLLAGMDVSQLRFYRDGELIRVGDASLEEMPTADVGEPELGGAFRAYHQVIHCLGFTWDRRPFTAESSSTHTCSASVATDCPSSSVEGTAGSEALLPAEDKDGKFAAVASNFESVNVPDLFVAGTLMHYRDFKRSAGGFIHGFRYFARTLVRQLRERYLGVPFPVRRLGPCTKIADCSQLLVDHYFKRLASVSSLYQLQGVLADVVQMVPREDKQLEFAILEDVPLDMVTSVQPGRTNMARLAGLKSFLTVNLEFGKYFQGTGILYHQSQSDTPSRAREKKLWTPETDPDAMIGISNASSVGAVRKAGAKPGPGSMMLEFMEGYLPVSTEARSGSLSRFNDGDPLPELPKESLMGFQFLHPVFRQWRRTPDRRAANSTFIKAELISEIHLREDVNNDWTHPFLHERPLRKYLSEILPALRLLSRA